MEHPVRWLPAEWIVGITLLACLFPQTHASAQQLLVKPEKSSIEVAIAAFAHSTMPMLIAREP